jgi:hypothetical protein
VKQKYQDLGTKISHVYDSGCAIHERAIGTLESEFGYHRGYMKAAQTFDGSNFCPKRLAAPTFD